MLVILHGTSTIKILLILGINYKLVKTSKSKLVERYWPGMVIVGNMLVLFLNERNDGYRFAHLHGAFEVVVSHGEHLRWMLIAQGPDGWLTASLAYQFQHHDVADRLFCLGLPLETNG